MTAFAGRFEDRVAVVTGGAQGIGLAVAQRLVAEGARVVIWDSNAEANESGLVALAAGVMATSAILDIVDEGAVEQAAAAVEATYGRIDVLVHSAGIAGRNATVADYDPAEWRRVVDVDLTGGFNVNQAVVKRMIGRGRGRIVNIASIAGKEGNPNAAAYSAANV